MTRLQQKVQLPNVVETGSPRSASHTCFLFFNNCQLEGQNISQKPEGFGETVPYCNNNKDLKLHQQFT